MDECTCKTISGEYSDHNHGCSVYRVGRIARLPEAQKRLVIAAANVLEVKCKLKEAEREWQSALDDVNILEDYAWRTIP